MVLEQPKKDYLRVDLNVRTEMNMAETMSQCFQCGTCTATCVLNQHSKDGDPRMIPRLAFHQAQLGLSPSPLVWNCTSCKACELSCPRDIQIVDNIQHIRRYSYKRKELPPEFEKVLWNILEEANPAGDPKAKRAEWAQGLDIKPATEGTDFLFYVGGPESYDPRLQKVAKGMVEIMNRNKIDFGYLGKQEPSSGEAIKEIGDYAYLDWTIEKNVELFNSTGADKIVVLSPHAYDLMKHIYPEYGLEAEVYHYNEVLDQLWQQGSMKINTKLSGQVTYHDPCYLGRYNSVYDQPRNLIEATGVEFIEMKDNRDQALCCGGGGNQMYKESEGGVRLSDVRMNQAKDTDVDIMVTSCGYCVQNFEDSAKVVGAKQQVNDLIELIVRAVR
ncbi:MAG: (Fe-S)-binding protein [Candidatus Kariarchaeaceae archaeon]|jgi:Fe-S oxidoreductase